MTDPRVAIILLNWNGWANTVECLESLLRMDYDAFSVIVCDQASTDDSVARIRAWARGELTPTFAPPEPLQHLVTPPVPKPVPLVEYSQDEAESGRTAPLTQPLVLVHNRTNLGSGGGNNVGLRFAYTQPDVKYVWILNNDIIVAPDALRELVRCAESDSMIGAVGGQLMDYRIPTMVQAAGGGTYSPWRGFPISVTKVEVRRDEHQRETAALDWVTGGNVLAPVSAVRRAGLIDESYFVYMEDIEHVFRIREAGYRFGYAPRSLVWHKGGGSMGGHHSVGHDYYMVRNALAVARRHHPRTMPFVWLYTVYLCVLPKVMRFQWGRIRTVFRAMRDYRRGVFGRVDLSGVGK